MRTAAAGSETPPTGQQLLLSPLGKIKAPRASWFSALGVYAVYWAQIVGDKTETGKGAAPAPTDRWAPDFSWPNCATAGLTGISPITGRRASAAFRRHTVTAAIWPIGIAAMTSGRSCTRLISCPLM